MLDIKFRFTCGQLNLPENTVNYKNIMSLTVATIYKIHQLDTFYTVAQEQIASHIFSF